MGEEGTKGGMEEDAEAYDDSDFYQVRSRYRAIWNTIIWYSLGIIMVSSSSPFARKRLRRRN